MSWARIVPDRRLWNVVFVLLMTLAVAGCTTDDDEGDDLSPTAGVTATNETDSTTVAGGTEPAGPLTEVNGQAISDGVCLAIIPDGWVDDGTGRGSITGGGRFVLFGGNVASDAAWQVAVNIVATPTAGREIASEERSADTIYVVYADDRGFEYRKRFGNRYCDLTVTSNQPISAEEQAIWPAILETLAPVRQ